MYCVVFERNNNIAPPTGTKLGTTNIENTVKIGPKNIWWVSEYAINYADSFMFFDQTVRTNYRDSFHVFFVKKL